VDEEKKTIIKTISLKNSKEYKHIKEIVRAVLIKSLTFIYNRALKEEKRKNLKNKSKRRKAKSFS
jgi:hypothetical protein